MLAHRFQHHLDRLDAQRPGAAAGLPLGSFVACPMPQGTSVQQQACIHEIYRIAAERTREQLRPQYPAIPEFSRN